MLRTINALAILAVYAIVVRPLGWCARALRSARRGFRRGAGLPRLRD
jgi:hypothetical protein